MDDLTRESHIAVEKYLIDMITGKVTGRRALNPSVRIDSVRVSTADSTVLVTFNPVFAEFPIRPSTVAQADSVIRGYLPEQVKNFDIDLYAMGFSVSDLIPQYYLHDKDRDKSRIVTRLENPRSRNTG